MARVLIAEDDLISARLLKVIIEGMGHIPLMVRSGRVALEILEDNSIDILITDMLMPQMDGTDLVRRIRERSNVAQLPVVMTCTALGVRELHGLLELGGTRFIQKPISPDDLRDEVRVLLREARPRSCA